jgi:NADH dehydrogenase [ubiquinone] 1 alpha subcomplex assembly factor 5
MNTSPIIFDRQQFARQRARAAKGDFAARDFLFREAADRLADRLDDVARDFPVALDLGSRNGQLREMLDGRGNIGTLVQTDCSPALLAQGQGLRAACDEEALPFADASLDLAMSVLSFSWINDVPGTLVQLRRALKPDGLLLVMAYGGKTLQELRDVLTRATLEIEGGTAAYVSPYVDVRDAGSLLQRAGFALPVVDSETVTVSYEHIFALMHDLRGMGEGNALVTRRKTFAKRHVFMRAAELYQQDYADAEGRITATFEFVTMTAWTPHASQQQPAQRGSGTVSLKDVLE